MELAADMPEEWQARASQEAPRAPGLQIMVRTYVPRVDQGFVLSNWARHIQELHPYHAWPAEVFAAHMHDQARLLTRETVLIACAPDHPEQDFGFVVGRYLSTEAGELPVLDFAYVRKTWRGKGVASILARHQFPALGKRPLYHTHMARAVRDLRKPWRLLFHPYLARPA